MGKCSWFSFPQKVWFLDLKHTTPKYYQNKIWAVKNLGNNVRTSVFGAQEGRKEDASWFLVVTSQIFVVRRISGIKLLGTTVL